VWRSPRTGLGPADFYAAAMKSHPGVRWIVTGNSKKARLAKLLG
jgi:hypothetical protein